MCNKGFLEEKFVDYKEFEISLGKFKASVCNSCGNIFFDSETAKKIQIKSKGAGLFGLAKKTKVAQVGNSLAIRVPKEISDFTKLRKGEEVKITPKSNKQILIEFK